MLVYLDNSATTKPYQQVIEVVLDCFENNFGNPSSLHRMGISAEKAVKVARNTISESLKVKDNELYFTSGGTESNNTAVFGAVSALKRKGNRIITSTIEHPAVLNVCKNLEQRGMDIKYVSVNNKGLINLEEMKSFLDENTILLSFMHVNNELGTIQPIKEIGLLKNQYDKVCFHVDAVQSYGKIKLYPKDFNVDMFSISAHKLHGPKGVGALYIRDNFKIPPLLYGGEQENNLRSGTENVPGISGFGKAVEYSFHDFDNNIKHVRTVKNYLVEGIKNEIKDIKINSFEDERCAPHIANISFLGIRGEVLLHMLEQDEIYVSTGSACSSKKKSQSHVLKAAGLSDEEIEGAVRFSFSKFNTIEEMDYVLVHLKKHINSFRKMMRK